jgi:hypothetical protein
MILIIVFKINMDFWVWQQFNPMKTLDPIYQCIKPYIDKEFYRFLDIIEPQFSGNIILRGIS